ncbi:MAG: shikimate kinase AroK [Woeseiaceae bacterium]|jgi:shikimate kinase|nr:shikimate kinase AroK [Woeseiaceae bacterium]
MNSSQNLFLVGPMGSGKSAVGRALARALHRDFYDSDDALEERTGVDIPFIFEKEGEPGFRQREARIIDELTALDGIVLATGGGAVVNDDNRRHLGARGFVIYLETSVDQQLRRTGRGRERPLLTQVDDRRALLEALMADREAKYREIADLVINTDGRKVQAVTRQILEELPWR